MTRILPMVFAVMTAMIMTVSPLRANDTDWTGPYIGAHGGGGFADSEWDVEAPGAFWAAGLPGSDFTFDPDGIVGGGQVGYMHQSGRFVFGADLSISGADLEDGRGSPLFAPDSFKIEIDFLLLLQARLGWAQDNWLVYLQGGYAGASSQAEASTLAGPFRTDTSEWHDGWTIGAGGQIMLTGAISIGAEYNYVDLGSESYSITAPLAVAPTVFGIDHEIHIIKAVVNISLRDLLGAL